MTSTASPTAQPGLSIEQVPLADLRPDPFNPRRTSDAELESLTRSIQQFGPVDPIIARREDHVVIGGHQRLVAARRLGLKTVPVVFVDLSAEQAKLLNLALNRISGDWDKELLARLLAELNQTPDVDLTLSGFGEDEIKTLLRSLDSREKRHRPETFDLDAALEAAQAAPQVRRGDLFALGDQQVEQVACGRPRCGQRRRGAPYGRQQGCDVLHRPSLQRLTCPQF